MIIVLLNGCREAENEEETPTPLSSPSPIQTQIEPTTFVESTLTAIPPTVTPFIPPTPTFQPEDITLEEALEIQDFLSSLSDECMLPCWQGVTPGISTGDDALRLFPRLGMQIEGEWPYTSFAPDFGTYGIFYPEDESLAITWVSINWNENYVTDIFLDYFSSSNTYEDAPFLLPPNLIEHLGSPQDIKINLGQGGYYALYMNFEDFNTALYYSGRGASKPGGYIEICFTGYELDVGVHIYYLEGEEKFIPRDQFYDLSEVIGFEIDEFIEELIDSDGCVLVSPFR